MVLLTWKSYVAKAHTFGRDAKIEAVSVKKNLLSLCCELFNFKLQICDVECAVPVSELELLRLFVHFFTYDLNATTKFCFQ